MTVAACFGQAQLKEIDAVDLQKCRASHPHVDKVLFEIISCSY